MELTLMIRGALGAPVRAYFLRRGRQALVTRRCPKKFTSMCLYIVFCDFSRKGRSVLLSQSHTYTQSRTL